jgi:hypothetical protein
MNLFERLARGRPAPVEEKVKVDPAQLLLNWLQRWTKNTITAREIRIYGPRSIRDPESVISSVEILVAHGWLVPHKPPRRDMRQWRIVRKGPIVHPTVAA